MDISIVKALPNDVVKALCNTLIHSLWQGLVLAAVAGLIVVFTRKATSAMRYNLLVASLCLFVATVAYTFVGQLRIAKSDPDKTFTYNLTTAQIQPIDITTPINTHVGFTDSLLGYLNSHANIVVLIWLLIVCARSIQLLTGLNSLYHLRRKYVFDIDEQWQNRVYQLSARLGITRMVRIAGSGIAKVPMVIGHLKPMILIPVGLIAALSAEEVDAILVHELAHIRRRDYLVNLLQSFMEIVFFFNPAVLWISTLIRAERENCCDDIAIAQTSNKASYIRALVSCQEYQSAAPAYAMAFGGEKNHLLGRVKRMVSNSNRSLNVVERSLLAACLLTAALITTAFSNADKIDKLVTATTKAVQHVSDAVKKELAPDGPAEVAMPKYIAALSPTVCEIKPEFLPQTDTTGGIRIYKPTEVGKGTSMQFTNNGYLCYLFTREDKLYQLNFNEGALVSVQINGKTLSKDELAGSRPMLDQLMMEQDGKAALAQQAQLAANANKLDNLNGNQNRLDALTDSLGAIRVSPRVTFKQVTPNVNVLSNVRVSPGHYTNNPINYTTPVYTDPVYPKLREPIKYKPYKNKTDDSLRNKIIDEMVNDGIINKIHDDLSFKLSTSEFIVNGKKLNDDVYKKYRSEYVKVTGHDEWSWYYNYDTSTKTKTETKSTTSESTTTNNKH